VPTPVAIPITVKVFCEVLGLIFIVLVRLTLANPQLPLNYMLQHLLSFKGLLFIATTVEWCHYLPILSEARTYICLNYTIIFKGYLQEKGSFV
jgi:hypothetical protein